MLVFFKELVELINISINLTLYNGSHTALYARLFKVAADITNHVVARKHVFNESVLCMSLRLSYNSEENLKEMFLITGSSRWIMK